LPDGVAKWAKRLGNEGKDEEKWRGGWKPGFTKRTQLRGRLGEMSDRFAN